MKPLQTKPFHDLLSKIVNEYCQWDVLIIILYNKLVMVINLVIITNLVWICTYKYSQ